MATKDPKTHDGVEATPSTATTGVPQAAIGGAESATTLAAVDGARQSTSQAISGIECATILAAVGGARPSTSQALGLTECTSVPKTSPSAVSAPLDVIVVPHHDGKRNENTLHKETPHFSDSKVVTPPNTVLAVKRTTQITHEDDSPARKKAKTFQLRDHDTKAKIEAAFKELYPQNNIPDTLHEATKSVLLNYTVKDMTSVLKDKLGVEAPKAKKKSDVAHFLADQLLKFINHNKLSEPMELSRAGQPATESVIAM